jgi:hypothetical protein
MMIVCEFCTLYGRDGSCDLGLNIAKGMRCADFEPGMERFCADSKDFLSHGQITEMATFFGIKGLELKKVGLMATKEESGRKLREKYS